MTITRLSCWLAALLIALAGCTQRIPTAAPPNEPISANASDSVSSDMTAPTQKAAPAPAAPRAEAGARLGTRWGEGLSSQVTTVEATRMHPDRPDGTGLLYYGRGVGRPADNQAALLTLPLADGRVELSILDANGNKMALRRQQGGRLHLSGKEGDRYQLSFTNLGSVPYEIVATVDGLDVISGQPGKLANDGYLLPPGRTLNIQGFRKNQQEVAAFRFSSVQASYANNTPAGDPNNTGVIGAAIFALAMNDATPSPAGRTRPPQPDAFPGDPTSDARPYAPPPAYRN